MATNGKSTRPTGYFAMHALFRLQDFAAWHQRTAGRRPHTTLAVLKQHVRAGNLLRLRRGLYAAVPRGQTAEAVVIDPVRPRDPSRP